MIGDVREHVFEVDARVDPVELARADETVHRSRSFSAAVGTGEQEVFSPEAHAAQGILSQHVADFDTAVVTEQQECLPTVERVVDRGSQRGLRPERLKLRSQARFEAREQRFAFFLADSRSRSLGGLPRISASIQ